MSFNIIIKSYEHLNRSFPKWDTPKGKYISSKRQYDEELKRGGFVEYEKGCRIAEQKKSQKVDYKGLTPQAENVIRAAHNISDRKGHIKPSDRLIDGMKEVGVNFYNQNIPKHYRKEGGFDATY